MCVCVCVCSTFPPPQARTPWSWPGSTRAWTICCRGTRTSRAPWTSRVGTCSARCVCVRRPNLAQVTESRSVGLFGCTLTCPPCAMFGLCEQARAISSPSRAGLMGTCEGRSPTPENSEVCLCAHFCLHSDKPTFVRKISKHCVVAT